MGASLVFIIVFVLLLLVALAALGVAIIGVALLAWRKANQVDATCGKCGYAVRGISTLTCPECGADLREVGIVPPRQSRKLAYALIGLGAGGFILTALLCAVGGVLVLA